MAGSAGPNIPENGLILGLDARVTKSNPKTGTTWFDISGKQNHITVPNGINTGDVLNFSNTTASRGGLSGFNSPAEVTFDTWFYVGSNGTFTGCCDTLFGTYFCRTFIIGQNVYTMIGFMDGSENYTTYQHPAYAVSYGSWHHTLGMRRGNQFIIWLNGVEVYNTTYRSGESVYGLGSSWIFAGNRHPDLKIGAARVWNRALSDSEIVQLYNTQKNQFGR